MHAYWTFVKMCNLNKYQMEIKIKGNVNNLAPVRIKKSLQLICDEEHS